MYGIRTESESDQVMLSRNQDFDRQRQLPREHPRQLRQSRIANTSGKMTFRLKNPECVFIARRPSKAEPLVTELRIAPLW